MLCNMECCKYNKFGGRSSFVYWPLEPNIVCKKLNVLTTYVRKQTRGEKLRNTIFGNKKTNAK